jgi:broad specificity phosphatase PhoE
MTRLLLARHGLTDWNQQGRYQGHADPPLNHIGRAQAEILASQVLDHSVEVVYSSDLIRALETAQFIASRLGVETRTDQRLREIHLGEWEGMYIDDIIVKYPKEWDMRKTDPMNARPPGGETLAELDERMRSFADEVSLLYPSSALVVVSHGLAIATLYCRVNSIPIDDAYQNIPDNARILEIIWPRN